MFIDLYGYQNLILFIARIVLGITFIKHGWPKIKQPLGMKTWLAEMRFPVPAALSVMVALVEFFGGWAVLAGVYLQEAALLIAADMLVATFVKRFNLKKNWVDGFELDLALLGLALMLALYGAGDWALL
ncbi:MAG: DoxX family protein [Candidatus Sungbacteria bacterium]|uniref:DoxX family protein n=1 Tax=Candidatus Sungiibacteriota bacterium TaxID=2750080 RepID=A0A931YDV2_9BACT|nr:DoxX family protein [Candidatus Sungbacteria bacterium]MBI2466042.1 DoxX family protein [Candidatus Sungbacteria bacterium]